MAAFLSRAAWLAAAGALGVGPGSHAKAQAGAEPVVVQEIIVTAQYRPQRASEVPFALSAYSNRALADLGIQGFEELSRFVPGLEVQNQSPNSPGFVMRGVSSGAGDPTSEPRVAIFQDGVAISRSRGAYVELFDLERVEVAKGPQTTLYGRGALIGGVNIIQNKARPGRYEASAAAEIGDYGYWMSEFALNAPLGHVAGLRLAGRVKRRDGYVDNLLGGEDFDSTDTKALRTAFNWSPGDALKADIIVNYQKDDPSGVSFKSLAFRPTDPVTGAVLGPSAPWRGAALSGASGIKGGRALGLDREVWGATAIVRYVLSPSWSLNSISAYREFGTSEAFDADGISATALTSSGDTHGRQVSQELRLSFEGQGRFRGFIGAAATHERGSERDTVQFDERVLLARLAGMLNGGPFQPGRPASDPAPEALFGDPAFTAAVLQAVAAAGGVSLPASLARGVAANLKPAHLEAGTSTSATTSFDLFADLTFKPSRRLELGLGARYTSDRKTSGLDASVLNGRSIAAGFLAALGQSPPIRNALLAALTAPGAADIPPSAAYPVPLFGLEGQPTANNGDRVTARLRDAGVTWRATARYTLNEQLNLYANYARGRRPQVLSARPPAAPGAAPVFTRVPAEIVDSVEGGFKVRGAGGRLTLDAALFHYWYDNFQTTEQVGARFVVINAGRARAYGFEGQAEFAATDAVDLFATYAYNHGRFRTGLRRGNRFRLTPDHSVSIGAELSFPLGDGELKLRPTYTWQSRIFFDDDNDLPALQQPPRTLAPDNLQDEVQKAYGLANLRLDYQPKSETWRVGLFVTNLFNKKYLKDAGNVGDAVGLPTFIAGLPRFVGARLSIRR